MDSSSQFRINHNRIFLQEELDVIIEFIDLDILTIIKYYRRFSIKWQYREWRNHIRIKYKSYSREV